MGTRFSAAVQTGPGDHPASYIMGTGSFLGLNRTGRDVKNPPHQVPSLKKEWSYTSAPPPGFVVCSKVNFTFTFIFTSMLVSLEHIYFIFQTIDEEYEIFNSYFLNFFPNFVCIVTGIWVVKSVVRLLGGAENVSLLQNFQTGFQTQPDSSLINTEGSFPRCKATGTLS